MNPISVYPFAPTIFASWDSAMTALEQAASDYRASGIEVVDWGVETVEGGFSPSLEIIPPGGVAWDQLTDVEFTRAVANLNARTIRARTGTLLTFPAPAKKSYAAYWVLGTVAAITLAIVAATVAAKK